jgi:hypothetical protein
VDFIRSIGSNQIGKEIITQNLKMKKQTAVDWLDSNLIHAPHSQEDFTHNYRVFEQAKEMHKEQIEKAFEHSMVAIVVGKILSPQDYYNKNYGK